METRLYLAVSVRWTMTDDSDGNGDSDGDDRSSLMVMIDHH